MPKLRRSSSAALFVGALLQNVWLRSVAAVEVAGDLAKDAVASSSQGVSQAPGEGQEDWDQEQERTREELEQTFKTINEKAVSSGEQVNRISSEVRPIFDNTEKESKQMMETGKALLDTSNAIGGKLAEVGSSVHSEVEKSRDLQLNPIQEAKGLWDTVISGGNVEQNPESAGLTDMAGSLAGDDAGSPAGDQEGREGRSLSLVDRAGHSRSATAGLEDGAGDEQSLAQGRHASTHRENKAHEQASSAMSHQRTGRDEAAFSTARQLTTSDQASSAMSHQRTGRDEAAFSTARQLTTSDQAAFDMSNERTLRGEAAFSTADQHSANDQEALLTSHQRAASHEALAEKDREIMELQKELAAKTLMEKEHEIVELERELAAKRDRKIKQLRSQLAEEEEDSYPQADQADQADRAQFLQKQGIQATGGFEIVGEDEEVVKQVPSPVRQSRWKQQPQQQQQRTRQPQVPRVTRPQRQHQQKQRARSRTTTATTQKARGARQQQLANSGSLAEASTDSFPAGPMPRFFVPKDESPDPILPDPFGQTLREGVGELLKATSAATTFTNDTVRHYESGQSLAQDSKGLGIPWFGKSGEPKSDCSAGDGSTWSCEGQAEDIKHGKECKLLCTGVPDVPEGEVPGLYKTLHGHFPVNSKIECKNGQFDTKTSRGMVADSDGEKLCVSGKVEVAQVAEDGAECDKEESSSSSLLAVVKRKHKSDPDDDDVPDGEEPPKCRVTATMTECSGCKRPCRYEGEGWYCTQGLKGAYAKYEELIPHGHYCYLQCQTKNGQPMDPITGGTRLVDHHLTCDNGELEGNGAKYAPHWSQLCKDPDESVTHCRHKGNGWHCDGYTGSGTLTGWTYKKHLVEGQVCYLSCDKENGKKMEPVHKKLTCIGGEFRGSSGTFEASADSTELCKPKKQKGYSEEEGLFSAAVRTTLHRPSLFANALCLGTSAIALFHLQG